MTHAGAGTVLAHWTGYYAVDIKSALLRQIPLFTCDLVSHDLVQPGRMDRGVDHDRVRVGPGQPADGGLAAVVRAVVHDDEHPGRVLVLRPGHDLPGEVHERLDPGGKRGGAEYLPGAHVQAGEQGEGALALVLVLVADGPAGRGGQGGVQAAAGIDLRLGVEGQDPVTGTERLALV